MFARILAAWLVLSQPAYAELSAELLEIRDELEAVLATSIDQSDFENRNSVLVTLADVQDRTLTITRAVLRRLRLQIQYLKQRIDVQNELSAKSLGALYSIDQAPVPQLLLNPQGAVGTVEAELLFKGLIPQLQQSLRTESEMLSDLIMTLRLLENHQLRMETLLVAIRSHRATLNSANTAGEDLPDVFSSIPDNQTAAARASQAIFDFSALIRGEPDLNSSVRRNFLGLMSWPTESTTNIVSRNQGVGATRRLGAVLTPKPLSQFRSPVDATVLFAGNLSQNRTVIVLEPERDLQIFVSAAIKPVVSSGDVVQKDQLIALFGPTLDTDNSLSSKRDSDQLGLATNEVYVEVRISGEPTDPFQWFEQEEKELSE